MSVENLVKTVLKNTDRVYQTGLKQGGAEERRTFWNKYQKNGERTNYQFAFAGFGFDFENFYPVFDIRPSEYCTAMFFGWTDGKTQKGSLKERLQDCNAVLDTSSSKSMTQCFCKSNFTELPAVALPGGVSTNMAFSYTPFLTTIDQVIVEENTVFTDCFEMATELEHVIFSGVIGQNGLNFSDSPKLSLESLRSILNCLKDWSQSTVTHIVTFGAKNLAKLTDADKAIATEKGWTLV